MTAPTTTARVHGSLVEVGDPGAGYSYLIRRDVSAARWVLQVLGRVKARKRARLVRPRKPPKFVPGRIFIDDEDCVAYGLDASYDPLLAREMP